MKLLNVQIFSTYFLSPKSKYFHYAPVLEHHQSFRNLHCKFYISYCFSFEKKILFGSVSARISVKSTSTFDKWPHSSSLKQNFKLIM